VKKKTYKFLWWLVPVLAFFTFLFLWVWIPGEPSRSSCPLSGNGAWINDEWTSKPVDEAAVEQLAKDASRREMRYLYPFVAYLKENNTFSSSYRFSNEFIATFHQFNRATRLLAWISIPLANEGTFGVQGTANLADVPTREKIVKFVLALLNTVGFDGIHMDVETVHSGDESYLLLLEETKAAIGDRILSVAGSSWLPSQVNDLPAFEKSKWDGDYYRAVAERVDQIVIMAYDSGMPAPALYRLWLREEVNGIEKNVAGTDVKLIVGISVSREGTGTHNPTIENMSNGLAGACAGAKSWFGKQSVVEGVAVYASWEADVADWGVWESWVESPGE
jgi:hypothetical protein